MTRLRQVAAALAVGALGLMTVPTAAQAADSPDTTPTQPAAIQPASGEAPSQPAAATPATRADRPIHVVVMLKGQPSSPSKGAEKSNLAEQATLLAKWKAKYGLSVDRQFGYLVNGFSATITPREARKLMREPEVASVKRERLYKRMEHTARELEGAARAFEQTGADGTGTVVAIVDSGIDTSHKDMRLDDCSKAKIKKIDKVHPGFTCKVPAGYNYADENYTVKDASSEPHGMHVSGIVAGNGSEGSDPAWKSHRIDGVAPNAQLLAMKVFSNKPGSLANDGDIIAAIEDSVKMGADVINMSLGSTNGVRDASDGMARAIEKAREAGVVSVIAAGNEGLNFSADGTTDDQIGVIDDGTLGAPAVQGSAFTVASIDNGQATHSQGVWNDGDDHEVPYMLSSGEPDNQAHPVQDVGLGRESDYKADTDLTGKYALIQRGEITFSDKYKFAEAHHAFGVIVYNSAGHGDEIAGMAGVDGFDFPSAAIPHKDGAAMAEALKAGKTVTMRLGTEVMTVPNPTKLQPSSFTSWGAPTTLDFEPEISGIGGSVYSTFNDNGYGTMSGTSMATPNVSGMLALAVQDLSKKRPELSRTERLKVAETALMNTALIPEKDGVPYAPRQVGAGLAQIDKALATDVLATVDGHGAAALHEVKGAKTFDVTLTNSGNKDRTFTVPAQQVIGESNEAGAKTTTSITDETLTASTKSVTVPAHGTAKVAFTLTPKGGDHFIEGWARLTSTDKAQPDLAVPYMGFAGTWNDEPIIKAPGEPYAEGMDDATGLVSTNDADQTPLKDKTGEHWVSPNDDGMFDNVEPSLVFLRNALDVEYQVLTADGKTTRTLSKEHDISRPTLADILNDKASPTYTPFNGSWDGTLYNPQTGHIENAPDGRYTFRVKARLAADQPWQTVDMPFGVDRTAPVIKVTKTEATSLTFTVDEKTSGLAAEPTAEAPDGTALTVKKTGDATYTVTFPAGTSAVTLSAEDRGANTTTKTVVLGEGAIVIVGRNKVDGAVFGTDSPEVADGVLTLHGAVSPQITRVSVGGTDATVKNGEFTAKVTLKEGQQTIEAVGFDSAGQKVASTSVTLTYDSKPPVIQVSGLNADGQLVPGEDGKVVIRGTVTDDRLPADQIHLTAGSEKITVNKDGSFEYTLTPKENDPVVLLTADDGVNTTTKALVIAGMIDDTPSDAVAAKPTFDNANCMMGVCYTPRQGADVTDNTFTLRGKGKPGTTIVFTPASRADDHGTMVDPTPIEVTVDKDGTYHVTLPMEVGSTYYRMEVKDKKGDVLVDQLVTFAFDVAYPTLTIDSPTLLGGTIFTSSDTVRFTGSAQDDGYGYTLSINNSVITELSYSGKGPESNKRTFDENVKVADGDTILIHIIDEAGNSLSTRVPVVVDKDAPEVAIAGASDNDTIREARDITGTVTDPNLASMTMLVDGKEVAAQSTTIKGGETRIDSTLVKDKPQSEDGSDAGDGSDTGATRAPSGSRFGLMAPAANPKATSSDDGTADDADSAPGVPEEGKVEPTHPTPTTLSSTINTSTLTPGHHTITVEGRDLAGNVNAKAISVTILDSEPPTEVGRVAITVDRADLGNQQALTDALVAALKQQGLTGDVTITMPEGVLLHEGVNDILVVTTDANGKQVSQEYLATITVRNRTITHGDTTVTGPFRGDDQVTIIETGDSPRTITLTHDPRFAPVQATVSTAAPEGSTVYRKLPNGTLQAVKATWENGKLTWVGEVPGVYLVYGPGEKPASGDGDSAQPVVLHPAAGTGPAASKAATGGSGDGLATTGTQGAAVSFVAAVAVMAGAALLASRRRRRS